MEGSVAPLEIFHKGGQMGTLEVIMRCYIFRGNIMLCGCGRVFFYLMNFKDE